MPFDPIDFFRQEPFDRPDPNDSTGGQEISLFLAGFAVFCVLCFLVLFPLPLIFATEAYDLMRDIFAQS